MPYGTKRAQTNIMNKSSFFIANLKMACSYTQTKQLAELYRTGIASLPQEKSQYILCPSYESLAACQHIIQKTNIALGAQGCAPYKEGAFTGQVSITSLQEIGCEYCLVGHSERRVYLHETEDDIKKQLMLCMHYNLIPILCLGESYDEYITGKGTFVLRTQLESIISSHKKYPDSSFLIAYEPIWAIGTGNVPDTEYLEKIYHHIQEVLHPYIDSSKYHVLYGGSVTPQTVGRIRTIPQIQGVLIGGASLDFQKFEKIVSLWYHL